MDTYMHEYIHTYVHLYIHIDIHTYVHANTLQFSSFPLSLSLSPRQFMDEDDADSALKGLMGRWYAGRPIMCEFSPVTDFREARCRQFDEGTCSRYAENDGKREGGVLHAFTDHPL